MAVVRSIRIELNTDFEYAVRWLKDDGDFHELSDARLTVREHPDATAVLLNASVSDGRITLDTLTGWAHILVSAAVTGAILYRGSARYDFVVTRAVDSRIKRLLEGPAVIAPATVR